MTLVEHEIVEAPAVPVFPELVRAAEIIRKRGWCQHELLRLDGSFCAVGALKEAVGMRMSAPVQDLLYPELVDSPVKPALEALQNALGTYVATWNDAPERTQDEVIELLERVGYGL